MTIPLSASSTLLVDLVGLGGLLAALTWPVPAALASWRGSRTRPRLCLGLWVAVAGAWWLTLAGLLLAPALAQTGLPVGPALVLAIVDPAALHDPGLAAAAVAVAAVVVLSPLALAAVLGLRDAARGSRHARRLRLVGDWLPGRRALVVPAGPPLAHTLPGWWRGTVVVSSSCLAAMGPRELDAVLAHERAHAAGRHHLVVAAFAAWERLTPGLACGRVARESVSTLLEVLADDAARRAVGAAATVSALYTRCAPPAGGRWRPRPDTLTRLRSLASPTPAPASTVSRVRA